MAKAKLNTITQPIVYTVDLSLTMDEAKMLKGILGCFIANGETHGVWQALRDAGVESSHAVTKYGEKRPLGTLEARKYGDIDYW